MKKILTLLSIFIGLSITFSSFAEAKGKHKHRHGHKHHHSRVVQVQECGLFGCEMVQVTRGTRARVARTERTERAVRTSAWDMASADIGGMPRKYCGYMMQKETGIYSRTVGLNLNRAIEWARVGSRVGRYDGQPGDRFVQPHHVSKIVTLTARPG